MSHLTHHHRSQQKSHFMFRRCSKKSRVLKFPKSPKKPLNKIMQQPSFNPKSNSLYFARLTDTPQYQFQILQISQCMHTLKQGKQKRNLSIKTKPVTKHSEKHKFNSKFLEVFFKVILKVTILYLPVHK